MPWLGFFVYWVFTIVVDKVSGGVQSIESKLFSRETDERKFQGFFSFDFYSLWNQFLSTLKIINKQILPPSSDGAEICCETNWRIFLLRIRWSVGRLLNRQKQDLFSYEIKKRSNRFIPQQVKTCRPGGRGLRLFRAGFHRLLNFQMP